MANVPPNASTRSRIPLKPKSVDLAEEAAGSNPTPWSSIETLKAPFRDSTDTSASLAWAYLATLVRLSWAMRNAAVSTSGGSRLSSPRWWKLTVMLLCSE